MPSGRQIIVQWNMPPGSAAAVASLEYHVRNSRSMNHMIDQKQVWTTSGRATARTSRPPHGRFHQSVGAGAAPEPHAVTSYGFKISFSACTLPLPIGETPLRAFAEPTRKRVTRRQLRFGPGHSTLTCGIGFAANRSSYAFSRDQCG